MDNTEVSFFVHQNGDWQEVSQAKFDTVMMMSKKAFLMVAQQFLGGIKMTFLNIEDGMVERKYGFRKVA
jgi:hypothetical protein